MTSPGARSAGREPQAEMVSGGKPHRPRQAQGNRLQVGVVESAAARGLVVELPRGDQRLVPEYLGQYVEPQADVVAVLQADPHTQRADRFMRGEVDAFLGA